MIYLNFNTPFYYLVIAGSENDVTTVFKTSISPLFEERISLKAKKLSSKDNDYSHNIFFCNEINTNLKTFKQLGS